MRKWQADGQELHRWPTGSDEGAQASDESERGSPLSIIYGSVLPTGPHSEAVPASVSWWKQLFAGKRCGKNAECFGWISANAISALR